MAGFLETLAGIVVSLVLFVVGYRSTVGARNERVRVARAEVVRILLRLAAVEAVDLTPTIINRTIAGKAAQHNVDARAVGPPALIANLLHAEVIDSDLLDPASRAAVLGRIEGAFTRGEIDGEEGEAGQAVRPLHPPSGGSPGTAAEIAESKSVPVFQESTTAKMIKQESSESRRDLWLSFSLAIISTALGILASLGTSLDHVKLNSLDYGAGAAAIVGTMLAVVTVTVTRLRDRERVREASIAGDDYAYWSVDTLVKIQREVRKAHGRSTYAIAGPADLLITLNDGHQFYIDIRQTINRETLRRIARRVSEQQPPIPGSASYVILTAGPVPATISSLLPSIQLPVPILIMTQDDLIKVIRRSLPNRSRLRLLR